MKVRRWLGETWYDSDRRSPCFSPSSPSSWSIANFSARTIQAMEIRLRELRFFTPGHKLRAGADITYLHLVEFTSQYRQPAIHIRKSRVWALRQFFHFPALHGHAHNIAATLPYPKIERTVPQFLTQEEYHRLIVYFSAGATGRRGLRNLVAFLLPATFGLRTSSLQTLNVDVSLPPWTQPPSWASGIMPSTL